MTDDTWAALYIRIPVELKRRIDMHARLDRRAMAKWCELALEDYVDTLDRIEKDNAKKFYGEGPDYVA
jgi:predicted transcriptional regulator